MSALPVTPRYQALLAKFPPRVIHSDTQNDRCIEALRELERGFDSWTVDEKELAELLTLLIEEYEERHYSLPKAGPAHALLFLMDQNGLKSEDLPGLLDPDLSPSDLLSGKRELTAPEIRRLSEHFHVSPELFF